MDLDTPPLTATEAAVGDPGMPSMDLDAAAPSSDAVSELEMLAELSGHTDRAWGVAWHPCRPILASCSTDRQIRMYNYTLLPPSAPIRLDEASSDEDDDDGTAKKGKGKARVRFDLTNSLPTGHSRTVRSLAWSPTGHSLAAASFDATASVWEQVGGLASTSGAPQAKMWEIEEERASAEEQEWECSGALEGHESECKSVAWSASGNLVATCSRDKSVWVWEALPDGEFEVLAVLMDHDQDVKSVTWHPREELLASCSYDDTILLYAEDAGMDEFGVVHRLKGHESTVWTAVFSPDGEFLASGSDDLTIRLWAREKRDEGGVEGRDGGKVGGWRIGRSERERWTCISVLAGYHERTIYSLDWAGDRRHVNGEPGEALGRIVSAGGDGRINVFHIARGTPVSGLDAGLPEVEHSLVARRDDAHGVSDVNCVSWCKMRPSRAGRSAYSPEPDDDGDDSAGEGKWKAVLDWVATAGDDGMVRVWAVAPLWRARV